MGNRLTQIATRTGDAGTTGLGDNTRVSKDSLRVHAMGDVDELNSQIGLLLCEDMGDDVRTLLVEIQHQLFNLGGELSIPGFELLKPEAVLALDEALATHNAALPRLQALSGKVIAVQCQNPVLELFILPSGDGLTLLFAYLNPDVDLYARVYTVEKGLDLGHGVHSKA